MTKLFLDDNRTPEECVGDVYESGGWDLVRDYEEFITYIMERGMPDIISFDHDLADEHYDIEWCDVYKKGYLAHTNIMTGLDCAVWLHKFCEDSDTELPECIVHSMNPIGREVINEYIESWKQ